MRMLCAEGILMHQDFVPESLTSDDWAKLTMAWVAFLNAGIYIDDTPGIKVNEIRSKMS